MSKILSQLKNKNFLCLWLAQIISQFGDRIHQMALIGLIAERSPGSTWGLAKVISFTIIPVFLVGPIAGVYVDRWDRRTILFICDFLRGLMVLTIPFIWIFHESMIPIYIVVFLVFCLSRFYVPAKMSILPDMVGEKDLLTANSLLTTTGMLAFVFGITLGAFIVELTGARGGFIWDAITFFISGILVWSIAKEFKFNLNKSEIFDVSREMITTIRSSLVEEIKDGVAYLVKHKEIRFIINILFILLTAAGAIYVVIIVFIQEAFGSVVKDLGLLAPVLGLGFFVGALLYGRCGQRLSRIKTIFICLFLGGGTLILFVVLTQEFINLWVTGILAFLLGLIVGPIMIAANTIVHQVCHDDMRGKVFSSLEIVIHFAFLVAMLTSAFLAEYIRPFWILSGVGMIFSLVGLVGLVRAKSS